MPTPDLVNTLRKEAEENIHRLQRIVDAIDAEFPRPGRPRAASANGRRKTATRGRRRRRTTKAPAAA